MAQTQVRQPFPISRVVIVLTWAAIFGILWRDQHREAAVYEAALQRAQTEDAASARRDARIRSSFRVYTERSTPNQATR